MRKSPNWRGDYVLSQHSLRFLLIVILSVTGLPVQGQTPTPPATQNGPTFSVLIQSQIRHRQADVERIRGLVANGTLARIQLTEAEERLADAQDEGVLADTLYDVAVEKMTEQKAKEMMDAAQRRVDRGNQLVDSRHRLLETGAIAQSELDVASSALETRKQVLVLAQNRTKLLADLKQMAETEERAKRASADAPRTLQNSLIRFQGNGAFSLADVPAISSQFERRFHQTLPVSALGQTLLHQSLGLDHRNRVDIALNPDSNEGLWLRKLLEKLQVPYLAFNSAVAGAATAPHIHIGMESTRLRPSSGG